jgi:LacI family transcriptional regulator
MNTPRRIGLALEVHLLYKHHTEMFAGVQRYADEHGWVTILDDWICETLSESPLSRPAYDGVIARIEGPRLRIPKVAERYGVPVVNVYGGSPMAKHLPGVFPDSAQAGRMRAEHLLSRGLRNFASWSAVERPSYQQQADAFDAAIAEAGYRVARLDLPAYHGSELANFRRRRKRVHQWMDQWVLPIGVAFPADDYARQIAQIARERGWRVPEDVAIIGGMNEEHLCENPRPTITSVEMGIERVGYEAARLLESLMDSRGPKDIKHKTLPPVGIVVRESTDFYASGDDVVSQAQAFIASQCHTHLDVGAVAAKVCVSIRTLQNRFHEVLHRTVGQEILRVRLERVKRELVGSDRSIKEIATRAGFPSNAKLSAVFRRETGISPREYRAARTVP